MYEHLRRPEEKLLEAYGEAGLAAQVAMEKRMVSLGAEQVAKQINKAREAGMETGTGYGKTLVAMSVEKIGSAVAAFIEKANSGKAGRRHVAVKYLKLVDPEVAAFIAMHCVVNNIIGKKQLVQRAAIQIGTRLEDEVRFAIFADTDKAAFKRATARAKKATSYSRKQATVAGFERAALEDKWVSWPEIDRLHTGLKMIDFILETGLIELGEEAKSRKRTNKVITPTAKLVEWVEKEVARSEYLSPQYLPMVVKPLDWTTPFNGGYLTRPAQGRNTLVKTGNQNHLMELADHASEMPSVYECVNALQSTRWRINARLHSTMRDLWEAGSDGALPSREDHGHVPCPNCGSAIPIATLNTRKSIDHACFEDPETLRNWKRAAFITHRTNVSLRSKRLQVAKTLKVAGMFADCEAIHFPYQLDFRGRIYCIPSFNPQGNDATKGLLTFADAKPIEDGVAAGWLAIHGANVFGYDKASLEDRIEWVEKHEELITMVAEDPIAERWWQTADKPWQFLAFCFEWAGFVREGYGFMSSLPVALDGSCSGIQHFSAMLRDRIGGAAVNLLPADKPQDIYQTVCDRVVAKLKQAATGSLHLMPTIATAPRSSDTEGEKQERPFTPPVEVDLARGWLELEPDRKATKRQVMTLPYGSTIYSCREYTEAWMKEAIEEKGRPWPEEHDFYASRYMGQIIWESIGEVVVAATEAMGWLRKCAKAVAAEQLPVYWTTPCGFRVMQSYKNTTSRRVGTVLGDSVVKLSLSSETDTIDKRRMQSAISPNVVHSLDAAHLMTAVSYGEQNGISAFAMIHDSFGTHAADTNLWSACVRRAFVDLYSEGDVLEDLRGQFLAQVAEDKADAIPPVPSKGDLDLEAIMEADFSFC